MDGRRVLQFGIAGALVFRALLKRRDYAIGKASRLSWNWNKRQHRSRLVRGRHLADALAKAAIDAAHAERLQIVAVCPFVKAYMRKHPHRDTTPEKDSP